MHKKLLATFIVAMFVPALSLAGAVPSELMLDSKVESMHKAGVGPVKYPHAAHEKLYKCNECHPKIFKEKRNASGISMKLNMEGNFCGAPGCHNSPKAFPLFMCQNCHTNVGAAK